MKIPLILVFLLHVTAAIAQDFPFGSVGLLDLTMKRYDKDTGAAAVVLKEFGEARINNGDSYDLIFK